MPFKDKHPEDIAKDIDDLIAKSIKECERLYTGSVKAFDKREYQSAKRYADLAMNFALDRESHHRCLAMSERANALLKEEKRQERMAKQESAK